MISEESLKQLHQTIEEHFSHFALVVIDYEDELYVDYSSQHTAQSLFEQGADHLMGCYDDEDNEGEEWREADV